MKREKDFLYVGIPIIINKIFFLPTVITLSFKLDNIFIPIFKFQINPTAGRGINSISKI